MVDIDVLVRASILDADQLWVFKLLSYYLKKKFHWWGLRDVLIHEYKDELLGVNLILSSFSGITIIRSPLGPKGSLSPWFFDPNYDPLY